MSLLAFIIASACFQIAHAILHELPAHYPHCRRSDPDLNGCLLRATEAMRPLLIQGLPEFNIPSLKELTLPLITLEQGTAALNFKAVLHNVSVRGLESYKFSKMVFDVPALKFYSKASLGNMTLQGDYTIEGRILIAPVHAKGKFTGQIKSGEFEYFEDLEIITKNHTKYIHQKSSDVSLSVSEPKADISGLFEGNDEINKVTNQVLKDNSQMLFEDLKPTFEQVIGSVIDNLIIKKITSIPYDKLYAP